jgi:hypothetical protein
MTPVALVTQGSQQWWVTIELPLPVDRAFQQQQDLVCAADEGDWPGGMQQVRGGQNYTLQGLQLTPASRRYKLQ